MTTTEPAAETPTRRVWSVSAAKSYDVREGGCPRQWSYRYGPHRSDEVRASGEADYDVARRVGKVLHAGLQAAVEAARDDTRPIPPGSTLRRYRAAARAALGAAWDAERMPSDSVLGGQVMEMFDNALDDIAAPAPGTVYAVERREEVVGPQGTPLAFVADYAYWVSRVDGGLRIVDWKSGKVDPDEIARHWQLLVYAALVMRMDARVRFVEIELYSLRLRRGFVHRVAAEQAARALRRLENVAARADADADPAPRPGAHCVSCRFRTICPASAAPGVSEPPAASPVTLSAVPPTGRNDAVSSTVKDRELSA